MILLSMLLWVLTPGTQPLTVKGVVAAKGQVRIAVYNKADGFMQIEKAIHLQAVPVKAKGTVLVQLPDFQPGYYAIACYQDENNNQRLDSNWFGVPTEAYGFSNNARPKFRAPSWDEACIYLKDNKQPLSITIGYW